MSDAETKLTAPIVNLNGSSRASLKAQQRAVYDACYTLIDCLGEAAPHGRDYQGAPEGTYEKAREQWEVRMKAVEAIQQESMRIFRAIDQ